MDELEKLRSENAKLKQEIRLGARFLPFWQIYQSF